MYDILELNKKLIPELKEIAKELNVKKADALKKQDLVYKILDQQAIKATDAGKNNEPETSARKGKRPRNRSRAAESIMSVSPNGTKKTDEKPAENEQTSISPDEKSDILTQPKPQPYYEEKNETEKEETVIEEEKKVDETTKSNSLFPEEPIIQFPEIIAEITPEIIPEMNYEQPDNELSPFPHEAELEEDKPSDEPVSEEVITIEEPPVEAAAIEAVAVETPTPVVKEKEEKK